MEYLAASAVGEVMGMPFGLVLVQDIILNGSSAYLGWILCWKTCTCIIWAFGVLRGARPCSVVVISRRHEGRPNKETTEWPGLVL